jgi:hypothetical protein
MRHFHSYGPVDSKAHFCVQRQVLIAQGVEQLIGRDEDGGIISQSGHHAKPVKLG